MDIYFVLNMTHSLISISSKGMRVVWKNWRVEHLKPILSLDFNSIFGVFEVSHTVGIMKFDGTRSRKVAFCVARTGSETG